jgi:hypothetical protein
MKPGTWLMAIPAKVVVNPRANDVEERNVVRKTSRKPRVPALATMV